jgi:hypothetical protein
LDLSPRLPFFGESYNFKVFTIEWDSTTAKILQFKRNLACSLCLIPTILAMQEAEIRSKPVQAKK